MVESNKKNEMQVEWKNAASVSIAQTANTIGESPLRTYILNIIKYSHMET